MLRAFLTMLLGATLILGLGAQAPMRRAPAPPPKPPQTAPQTCDPKDSAGYVAGVDAYGRPVAPADLPSDTDVIVSREVYQRLKSKNPQLGGVGVAVRIDGLGTPHACRETADKALH